MSENYRPGTLALHAGQEPDPTTNSRAVPIYATTSYTFNDTDHAAALFGLAEFGNIYSRLMNPTVDVLEKRLAALDGGVTGLCFASGQSAITAAILTITRAGQNIVSSTSLYGGTWTLFTQTLKNLGIEVRFFDPDHPEQIHELVDENTRLVYMESIGNPKNDVPDFKAIADAAHSAPHGAIPVLCDNTVMTPVLLKPIEHGIDIVIYSTTKFIGGHGVAHGRCDRRQRQLQMGGPSRRSGRSSVDRRLLITGPSSKSIFGRWATSPYLLHTRTHWLRDTGAAMSPFAAFLFLQGLETLHLRMPRHCENALKVAEFLESSDDVEWVNYPGLKSHKDYERGPAILARRPGSHPRISESRAAWKQARNSSTPASSVRTWPTSATQRPLVIHPASTTHQQLTPEEQATDRCRPGIHSNFRRNRRCRRHHR